MKTPFNYVFIFGFMHNTGGPTKEENPRTTEQILLISWFNVAV